MPLSPRDYYAEPLAQAQMRGAQLGQLRGNEEMRRAKMDAEMQAYGVGSMPELMSIKATETREAAENQKRMKRFESFGNAMQDWDDLTPEIREAALADPEMREAISEWIDPDSLKVEKDGMRFLATTAFPGKIKPAKGEIFDGMTTPGQEYLSVNTPQGEYFKEVVGTKKLAGTAKKEKDPAKILQRISAIQGAKMKIKQTGGIDPWMMAMLPDDAREAAMAAAKSGDKDAAIAALENEERMLNEQLPEEYRQQAPEAQIPVSNDAVGDFIGTYGGTP